ncbi:MFS transporter [Pseudomonas sp. Q1-7]|uniref:MFS transporter n=1 Tax=Pseudomonas sp. Q1-7 TaxID=3020843 RepID=UPI00230188CB|nr:MFS transporter [Pseudomonas sp. Q1-7]
MTRAQARRRLGVAWWRQLLLTLAPLFLMEAFLGGREWLPALQMPMFIVGLLAMFPSLKLFAAYKRALVATEAVLDTPEEPAAWTALGRCRAKALQVASLPAWIAALAVPVGLNGVALFLLAMSSLVLLYLYRIPRQLG